MKNSENDVLNKKARRLAIKNRNSRERIFDLAASIAFLIIGFLLNDDGLEVMMSIAAVLYPYIASIRLDSFMEKGDHVGARWWKSLGYYFVAMVGSVGVGFVAAVILLAIGL